MALTSDELGEKGQQRFAEWCNDVGLVCNPSTRDRAGWDFVVDFPHAPSKVSLDHRRGPRCCSVQVKTVKAGSNRVRLRLDMAERLAKDVRPAFIISPVVDGLQFSCVFIWHIRGEHLGAILARLRKEDVDGEGCRISTKYITFALTGGERLEASGAALRQAFESACMDGMDVYSASKARERRQLGYEGDAVEATMELRDVSASDVLDFMLGLRKEIPGEITSLVEHRFGIPIALPTVGPGMLSFEARPTCGALMRIESPSLPAPIIERCELFSLPHAVLGMRRAYVRGRVVNFTVTQSSNGTATGALEWQTAKGMKWTLADWETYALVRRLPGSASVTVEVDTDAGGPSRFRFPTREPEVAMPGSPDRADAIGTLRRLVTLAGVDPTLVHDSSSVWAMADAVYSLTCLEHGAAVHVAATGNIAEAVGSTVVACGEVSVGQTRILWDGLMTDAGVTTMPEGFDVRCFMLNSARRVKADACIDSHATRLESEREAAFAVVADELPDGYRMRAVVPADA